MKIHNDLLGMALNDYMHGRRNASFIVHSPDFDEDEIKLEYYFRSYDQMPVAEQKALEYCRGKILDAGAGAGSHSLYLMKQKHDVTALDISGGACEVMKTRGLTRVVQADIFSYEGEKFDTILMMMNGIGICGSLGNLSSFMTRLAEMLRPGGQLIFDSANIIYLFQDEDDTAMIDLNSNYYGEIIFRMEYDGWFTPSFNWLYIDFDTLSGIAEQYGFRTEMLFEGENYQYLARILI